MWWGSFDTQTNIVLFVPGIFLHSKKKKKNTKIIKQIMKHFMLGTVS
jgi:hypothetical protein